MGAIRSGSRHRSLQARASSARNSNRIDQQCHWNYHFTPSQHARRHHGCKDCCTTDSNRRTRIKTRRYITQVVSKGQGGHMCNGGEIAKTRKPPKFLRVVESLPAALKRSFQDISKIRPYDHTRAFRRTCFII